MSTEVATDIKSYQCLADIRACQLDPALSNNVSYGEGSIQSRHSMGPILLTDNLHMLINPNTQVVRVQDREESDKFTNFTVWREPLVLQHQRSGKTSLMIALSSSLDLVNEPPAVFDDVTVKQVEIGENPSEVSVSTGTYSMTVSWAPNMGTPSNSSRTMMLNLTLPNEEGPAIAFDGPVKVMSRIVPMDVPSRCGWFALEPCTEDTYIFGLANVHLCGNDPSTLHLYWQRESALDQSGGGV